MTPTSFHPPVARQHHSYLEPIPSHTTPILSHQPLAIVLWLFRVREKHAFVSCGFLVFAYATWLRRASVNDPIHSLHVAWGSAVRVFCDGRYGTLVEWYLDFLRSLSLRLQ